MRQMSRLRLVLSRSNLERNVLDRVNKCACVHPVPARLTKGRKNGWLPFYFSRELLFRCDMEAPHQRRGSVEEDMTPVTLQKGRVKHR